MKAKEWAAKFNAANPAEVPAVLAEFIREIDSIAESRGATPLAYVGAIQEQKTKFDAVCRLSLKVRPSMYAVGLREFGAHLDLHVTRATDAPKAAFQAQYGPDHPATKKREARDAKKASRARCA